MPPGLASCLYVLLEFNRISSSFLACAYCFPRFAEASRYAGSLMPDFSIAFWLFFAALRDALVGAGGSLEILTLFVGAGGAP